MLKRVFAMALALLLVLVMVFTMGMAIAEDETGDIAVIVNGESVSAALVMQYAEYQLANGYTETLDYETAITDLTENVIINQKIRELGLDQFTDAEKALDKEKIDELFKRTPGYVSWQGENWLACCDDYCEYLGDVGYAELKEMNLIHLIDEFKEEEDADFDNEVLEKGGSPAGYLFRCLHCGKYRLNVDFD